MRPGRTASPSTAAVDQRHWSTVETDDIASQLRESPDTPTLVDDLGAWLTGALDRHDGWDGGSVAAPIEDMLAAVGGFGSTLVLVSPEVGLAVVPATASGRRFADELGSLNQRVAELCDRVVLVVAGTGCADQAVGDLMEFAPVSPPDAGVAAAARARQDTLTKPKGALGRLEDLSVWIASCQGHCPPRQFERARVVVFAGDHGVARSGVSAYPPEVTAQMVANFEAGGAAINVLADIAGATVRVADLAVAGDALTDRIGAHKVRRGSGDITVEDALTGDETAAAIAAGRAIADEEVDAGADLLIAGDMGIGNTTPAAVLVAALTNAEPVAVVGFGSGVDDAGWARKTAAVRDALFRTRLVLPDPVALLRCGGGADLAAMAGFCAQAAVRRTPLLLDGMAVTAAALVAERLAPGARLWWQAGHRSTEPGHALALTELGLEPILDLRMRLGEGSGAALALPVLRAAVATLSSMATFADAGVSDQAAPPL